MVLLGLQSVTAFDDIVQAHERGQLPPTVMWGSCPSRFDATQAPDNAHTAFMWEKVPFRLRGCADNWDAEATAHGHRMLDAWADYAPNLRDAVREHMIRPAHHIPKRLPNMRDGDLLVGSLGHGQVGYNRPFPGAGHYRGYLDRFIPVRFVLPPVREHHGATGLQLMAGDRRGPRVGLTGPAVPT